MLPRTAVARGCGGGARECKATGGPVAVVVDCVTAAGVVNAAARLWLECGSSTTRGVGADDPAVGACGPLPAGSFVRLSGGGESFVGSRSVRSGLLDREAALRSSSVTPGDPVKPAFSCTGCLGCVKRSFKYSGKGRLRGQPKKQEASKISHTSGGECSKQGGYRSIRGGGMNHARWASGVCRTLLHNCTTRENVSNRRVDSKTECTTTHKTTTDAIPKG